MLNPRLLPLLFTAAVGLADTRSRELTLTKTSTSEVSTKFSLRNEYGAAATGWIVECHAAEDGRSVSRWQWDDEELALEPKAVEAGKEVEFSVSNHTTTPPGSNQPPIACGDFQVVAAAFADGTVSGDLAWIEALVRERRTAYRDIGKAIEKLKAAGKGETSQDDLVKELVGWQKDGSPFGPGTGQPGYAKSGGSRTGTKLGLPSRPFPINAAPGVTLWLLQNQKKSPEEAIGALTQWRDRLAKMPTVSATEETLAPMSKSMPRIGTLVTRELPDLVGKPAPDFTLKDVDGREVSLQGLRGKTVFLDFWATWCEPCRKEMPEFQAVQEEFKDRGLVVVAIDYTETAEVAKKFMEEQKYGFVNLLDPQQAVFGKYGGGAIPLSVLIDKDGVVRFVQQGSRSNQDFRAEVKKLGL